MSARGNKSMAGTAAGVLRAMGVALPLVFVCGLVYGQQTPPVAVPVPPATPSAAPEAGAGTRVSLDRVVAVVNGDVILKSELDAEQRFAVFQPLREGAAATGDELINRLIDRDLILQQMRLQVEPPISDAEVDAQLAILRKNIPQ